MDERKRILIIDDDKVQLNHAGEILNGKYDVVMAKSGMQGIDLLGKKNKPDLILLDVSMPELDGFETLTKIRNLPDCAEIPVIFLTSMDAPQAEVKGLKLGAVDYVTKPFVSEVLLLRIEKHLMLGEKNNQLNLIRQSNAITEFDLDKLNQAKQILTEQELAIAKLIVTGMSNHQIAEYLNLSYQYIKNKAHCINEKYGITRREDLRPFFMKED